MSAQEHFDTAINVLTGARFKTFGSTEDLLNHMAWGGRSWLLGEVDVAASVDELKQLLQKIDQRLDRLERSSRSLSR
jgi:hypothetical protein